MSNGIYKYFSMVKQLYDMIVIKLGQYALDMLCWDSAQNAQQHANYIKHLAKHPYVINERQMDNSLRRTIKKKVVSDGARKWHYFVCLNKRNARLYGGVALRHMRRSVRNQFHSILTPYTTVASAIITAVLQGAILKTCIKNLHWWPASWIEIPRWMSGCHI